MYYTIEIKLQNGQTDFEVEYSTQNETQAKQNILEKYGNCVEILSARPSTKKEIQYANKNL